MGRENNRTYLRNPVSARLTVKFGYPFLEVKTVKMGGGTSIKSFKAAR